MLNYNKNMLDSHYSENIIKKREIIINVNFNCLNLKTKINE